MERPYVMLTFDLEEFDIPEEYGQGVPESDQIRVTLEGLERVMMVLARHGVTATFFTTGNFASQNAALIRSLAQNHEIASHALYHAPSHQFKVSDIRESKAILEAITGEPVTGFRMPRLKPFDSSALPQWGFRYDSSVNPTWLPGRYNLLHRNPMPERTGDLVELPCSTTPWLRFPLFWLAFKNLPTGIYNWLCGLTLKRRRNLMLYFHPWEFTDIGGYNLPGFVKNTNGEMLARKLDLLITALKKQNAQFVTANAFCDHWDKKQEQAR